MRAKRGPGEEAQEREVSEGSPCGGSRFDFGEPHHAVGEEVSLLNPLQDDLQAIITYVNERQPEAVRSKNAKALALIQNFQAWYQNLGPLNTIFDQETLNEAKRRRNDINAALGQTIPLDQVPADAPQQPPAPNTWVSDIEQGVTSAPSQLISLIKVGAVVGVGIVLWNLYKGTKHEEHESEPEEDVETRAHRFLTHGGK